MKKIIYFSFIFIFILNNFFIADITKKSNVRLYKVPGGEPNGTINETISYSDKVIEQYKNPYEIPGYIANNYTCGITSGGNIIAWYNRIHSNLIPNYNAGKNFLGTWIWSTQGTEINNMFTLLYAAMGSNPGGVTISNYLNGLNNYVVNKGKTLTINSIYESDNSLNSLYKSALSSGKLLTIFLDSFNIITFGGGISSNTGYDLLNYDTYLGTHVMTVYGFYDVSYYDSQNIMFRKDRYLYVGTSYSAPSTALLRINTSCIIDDAYVTHVS